MGVMRGLLVVVISVTLFLSLLSMTFFGVLSSSLNYENVEQSAPPILIRFIDANATSIIDKNYNLIQAYCSLNPETEYVFSADGYTFDIPCSTAVQGKDAIIDEGIRDLVRKTYYTEYDCTFFECLKESPFFLVSESAYINASNKFYFFLLSSFLLMIALFLFIEKRINTFIISGGMLILSSLIFIKIDSLFASSNGMLFNLIGIFFSDTFSVSIKILIAGIILLAIGIILKIFKIGFKIEQFFSKFKKPEIKGKPMQKQPVKNIQEIRKKTAKRKH